MCKMLKQTRGFSPASPPTKSREEGKLHPTRAQPPSQSAPSPHRRQDKRQRVSQSVSSQDHAPQSIPIRVRLGMHKLQPDNCNREPQHSTFAFGTLTIWLAVSQLWLELSTLLTFQHHSSFVCKSLGRKQNSQKTENWSLGGGRGLYRSLLQHPDFHIIGCTSRWYRPSRNTTCFPV